MPGIRPPDSQIWIVDEITELGITDGIIIASCILPAGGFIEVVQCLSVNALGLQRRFISMDHVEGNLRAFSTEQQGEIILFLKIRFEKNMSRHNGLVWAHIQGRLEADTQKLRSLYEMERTGGEPDVVGYEPGTGEYIFYDCSPETPADRRNLCYDREALDSRKEAKPRDSAISMADAMGIEILSEEQYRELQKLGNFDLKTSSWLKTPPEIRALGGAIFGDRRYDHVFVYHNGASSYYGVRGFRGSLKV